MAHPQDCSPPFPPADRELLPVTRHSLRGPFQPPLGLAQRPQPSFSIPRSTSFVRPGSSSSTDGETHPIKRTLLKGVFGRTRSRLTGSLLSIPLPESIRTLLFHALLKRWKTSASLLSRPVKDYKSFSDFFSRRYIPEARPVESWNPSSLVSPADGRIVHIECIEDPHFLWLTQLKGASYQASAFLGTTLCNRDAYRNNLNFAQLSEHTAAIRYCQDCGRPVCTDAFLSPKRCLSAWKETIGASSSVAGQSGGVAAPNLSTFEEYVMRVASLKRSGEAGASGGGGNDNLSTTAESSCSASLYSKSPAFATLADIQTLPVQTNKSKNRNSSFTSCSTYLCDRLLYTECEDCVELEKKKMQWFYCVIYLAPSDYHHFHAPTDIQILNRKHFVGEVMPVCKPLASKLNNLFSLNERVVLESRWTHGDLFYGAIAAYNVADIKLVMEPNFATNVPYAMKNQKRGHCDIMYYGNVIQSDSFLCPECSGSDHIQNNQVTNSSADKILLKSTNSGTLSNGGDSSIPANGIFIKRGAEVGEFKLGSTVVLLFQAPSSFEWAVEVNDRVVVGQVMGGVPNQFPDGLTASHKQPQRTPDISSRDEQYFDVLGG